MSFANTIKIYFSVAVAIMMVTVGGGSFLLKYKLNTVSIEAVVMDFDFFKYSIAYAKADSIPVSSRGNQLTITNVSLPAHAQSVPVLLYHGIISKPDGANILINDFKNEMFALKKAGWQTVSIEDFYAFLQGKKELPPKSFLLTFDDGRKDSYYQADPILHVLGYKAVMFIITKYSLEDNSGNYYLSKSQVQEMIDSRRWEIETHTKDGHNLYPIAPNGDQEHFYSNKLWLKDQNRLETTDEFIKRVTDDLTQAKQDIQKDFGTNVLGFAYPFGDFGQGSVNFPQAQTIVPPIVQSIYPLSFYQVWPGKGFIFNYPNPDQGLIKRIDMNPMITTTGLMNLLTTSTEKSLPYTDNFKDDNGWTVTWGQMAFNQNAMELGSEKKSTGSSVFLEGSYNWQNYTLQTTVDWLKGQSFSLISRYRDDDNFASCNFSSDGVTIKQRLNNNDRTMVETVHNLNFPRNNVSLSMEVVNDKVSCYADGALVAYAYYLSPSLAHGGVGFKTWDQQIDNSQVIINRIKVQ